MSTALKGAAGRVEPPRSGRRMRNTAMMMMAAVAAVGVAGAVMTRRGNAPDMPEPAADTGKAGKAESDVDGQVHTAR